MHHRGRTRGSVRDHRQGPLQRRQGHRLIILLFGGTGLAGSGVLRACLDAPDVKQVRTIVRRSTGVTHPKLREVLHATFLDYSGIEDAFTGVDACCFCLGVSVQQVPVEAEYRRIHQEFPLAAAQELRARSPKAAFHYLSGGNAGLDSWWMWARVKAEAERDLIQRYDATCWRPAMIGGTPAAPMKWYLEKMRPATKAVLKRFKSMYIEPEDIGRAMLEATRRNMRGRIFENTEMRDLAAKPEF